MADPLRPAGLIDTDILIDGARGVSEARQFLTELRGQGALQLYLSHGLAVPDALIAATAIEHSLAIYTRNARHFSPISGLQVIQPY